MRSLFYVFLLWGMTKAIMLPPFRGTRQLLAVGPWGQYFDRRTPETALYIDAASLTAHELPQKALPPPPKNHRRVVTISDTHGKHRKLTIPPCDVLCHTGDISQKYGFLGSERSGEIVLRDFARWLEEIGVPSVVIAGNHDAMMERIGDEKVRKLLRGAHYLRDSSITVDGLVFWGSPWSPSSVTKNSAFQQGVDATVAAARVGDMPRIDVLLTHARCPNGAWNPVIERYQPLLWAHGHWHNERGRLEKVGNCLSVNVASNDMIYRPKNPPVVMDVPCR